MYFWKIFFILPTGYLSQKEALLGYIWQILGICTKQKRRPFQSPFPRVGGGARTHDLQIHNLAL